jgi:hypothetical protein
MAIICYFTANAQTKTPLEFKAEYIYGSILKLKHLDNLVKGPISGGEFAIEWQTVGNKPWNQYLHFPKVGIGAVYLYLNNPDTLGNLFAIYPYINLPIIRNKFINIYLKPGVGVSYLTKTFKNATAHDSIGNIILNKSNAAIGSHLNVYFAGSMNIEIPLASGISLTADLGWNHASNGSFIQPNSGLNMMNTFVGLKYCPNYKQRSKPEKRDIPNLSNHFTTEIVLSGGARQLYYLDNRFYPIGSITVAEFLPLSNAYRMGIGVDAFYDGVYDGTTLFSWTYLKTNELKNKFRVGVSWQHEMIIGKLTAGFHFGLYLYDPIKNLEPYNEAKISTLKKPLVYGYNIDKENGWLYTRASLKYALSKHVFASLGLKTHLQKAEFIEWGVGYRF